MSFNPGRADQVGPREAAPTKFPVCTDGLHKPGPGRPLPSGRKRISRIERSRRLHLRTKRMNPPSSPPFFGQERRQATVSQWVRRHHRHQLHHYPHGSQSHHQYLQGPSSLESSAKWIPSSILKQLRLAHPRQVSRNDYDTSASCWRRESGLGLLTCTRAG
jgi:hypothetical protein